MVDAVLVGSGFVVGAGFFKTSSYGFVIVGVMVSTVFWVYAIPIKRARTKFFIIYICYFIL